MNIVLIGMPGCGKTSIGKILANKLNTEFYDIDNEIEKAENRTISKIFEEDGEELFRELETKMIKEISGLGNVIISTGGGVVKNKENIKIAKKSGIVVFINRPIEDIINDIQTEHRPLLADGKERIYKLYDERINLYMEYSDIEVTNDCDMESVARKIIGEVKNYEDFDN